MNRFIKIFPFLLAGLFVSCSKSNDQSDVKEDVTYHISFTSDEYVTFSGKDSVKKGSDYTFSVNKNNVDNFDYSNMKILVNDVVTSFSGTSYVIKNVQSDLNIKQEGATHIQCSVSFVTYNYVLFNGGTTVNKGEDYTFTVTKLDEQKYDYSNMSISCNGKVVTPVDGVYTISNVTKNITILVSGVISNLKTVTFLSGDLFTFIGEEEFYKGEDYSFSLTPKNKYIVVDTIEVSVNGVVVTPVDGVYTVVEAKTNLKIEVTKYEFNDPNAGDNQGDNPIPDLD